MIKRILKKILKRIRRFKNRIKFCWMKSNVDKDILLDACNSLNIEKSKEACFKLKSPCFTNKKNCSMYIRDNAKLEIGANTFFNENCIIVARKRIFIGDNCLFGPNVYICDHDHEYDLEKVYTDKFTTKEVYIGDGTWVGAGCLILKGATIGKNCIIAAGSVITGDIPDYSIVIQKRNQTIKHRDVSKENK